MAKTGTKYPDIQVQLSGEDGNAFAIMSAVTKALRRNGIDHDEIEAFKKEAMGGDYNALLRTCMRWVDVL